MAAPPDSRDWARTLAAGGILGVIGGGVLALAAVVAIGTIWSGTPADDLIRATLSAAIPPILADALRLPLSPIAADWLSRAAPGWQGVAVAGAALGVAAGATLGGVAGAPRPPVTERGRIVTRGARAAAAESRRESRHAGGPGVHIHPEVRISRDRETRGIMLSGSVGAGKTVILQHLIGDILANPSARLLIHDIKGDFTATVPGLMREAGGGLGLIAPWDARSMRWSVAADIRSSADARELASRLIPSGEADGTDSHWTQGAAMILGGLIVSLARRTRGQWGWRELVAEIGQSYPQLREAAIAGAPATEALLTHREPSPTTASYLSLLTSSAGGLISDLAAADAEHARHRPFSARQWLRGHGPRVVILGGSTRYATLATALHSSIVRAIAGGLDALEDDPERRIWLVLDEAAQLGRVDLQPIVETGRSKGVCVVTGWQDVAQRRKIYGADAAAAMDGMTGTHIIGRLLGADSQQWAAQMVGQRRVRRYTTSYGADGRSVSEQVGDEAVIPPDEWGGLGRVRDGIEAVLIRGGRTVHRVVWPFPDRRQWRKVTPPHRPAAWTDTLQTAPTPSGGDSDPDPTASPRPAAESAPSHRPAPEGGDHGSPPAAEARAAQEDRTGGGSRSGEAGKPSGRAGPAAPHDGNAASGSGAIKVPEEPAMAPEIPAHTQGPDTGDTTPRPRRRLVIRRPRGDGAGPERDDR
ncbi:type IV secretion system DNA-binding domain-containing protein [Arhodomonas aquaeolei]|uniref:type IV secretion system DNA-binding domain-containing protein n=1 Tax=Arhodomonas aquaeolei TaxID=2369 RepID=UPI000377E152|nr:type IV secretion system DNA-binding domain-containing protein [Arhodomonas aquaeolei]